MGKIKIQREYIFDPYTEDIIWEDVKKKCQAKDDYILNNPIEFIYYEEETDEEYNKRITREKKAKELVDKIEYQTYLELKKKYENDNTRND